MDTWRFASIVWRRLWLIVLLTVVAGGTAYAISNRLPKEYESDARILVGSLTEPNIDLLQAHQQLAQVYAEVAMTTPVLERVIQQLQWSIDPEHLANQLEVRAPIGDSIIRVVGTASSASDAAQLANDVADEIVLFGVPADGQQPSLATVIQPAVPPNGPSSPRVFLNTLIAAVLGMFVGLGFVLLLASRPVSPIAAPLPDLEPSAGVAPLPAGAPKTPPPAVTAQAKTSNGARAGGKPANNAPNPPPRKAKHPPPKRSIRLWWGQKGRP